MNQKVIAQQAKRIQKALLKLQKPLAILIFLITLSFPLKEIIIGSIPFWYDPARDFLAALANLQKPTLLGPPTGIPGIFYGPYWIWLISLGLLISKDPRVVILIVQTLPYFIFFPLLLFKLTKNYGKYFWLLPWTLFILAYKNYTTYLWNPHLAPLIFLALIYFLSELNLSLKKLPLKKITISGCILGLLLNFHMSFAIGAFFASIVYFVIKLIPQNFSQNHLISQFKKLAKITTCYTIGVFIVIVPTIIFETRHQFLQTKALLENLNHTIINKTNIIGLQGMSSEEIIYNFYARFFELIHVKPFSVAILLIIISVFVAYIFKFPKPKLKQQEVNILLLTLLFSISTLSIYLSTKNPVWHYHFIAVEIIFLLLIAFIAGRLLIVQLALFSWAIYLIVSISINFFHTFSDSPLVLQSVASKKYIIETVYHDANKKPFSAFAYSSHIYTYDFDYVFKWLSSQNNWPMPVDQQSDFPLVYLIIPEAPENLQLDFINYKTPKDKYTTTNKWQTPDKTLVIKRQLLSQNE